MVLAKAGLEAVRIFRVYAAGDELADCVQTQLGAVSTDTVLYLDSRDRPRTALRLPDGRWTSRPGWGEPAKRAPA